MCHDGPANPHQLLLDHSTVGAAGEPACLFTDGQVVGLQLTHSGRYARPDGAPAPRTAYRHPLLDGPSGASDATLLSDGELDDLVALFVDRAVLAREAGFDFVDVKACHGYLGHELLTAHDRGGDLRVPHFAATHLMQALPIAGLLADRLEPAAGRWLLPAATVAGVVVPVALFVLALRGVPFCAGVLCLSAG